MDRCQYCGRHPAKYMTFRAHQGFVVFRREIQYSGMFCRDCALAVYAKARGVTLAGMWFSPGSLVMGALGSIWDSAKLLDLPAEVKDEPWTLHKVGCPNCKHGHFIVAGAAECENCGTSFVLTSCEACGTIHTEMTARSPETIDLTCRHCGRVSQSPSPVRNSPRFLLPRAMAEVASSIGVPGEEFADWCAATSEHHGLEPQTWPWIGAYFADCGEQTEIGQVLQNSIRFQQVEFLGLVFWASWQLSTPQQFARLRALVRSLGFDPDLVFAQQTRREAAETSAQEWHAVLGVAATATLETVELAYRRLARQFHPDLWQNGSAEDLSRACQKMKELNAAYAQAKADPNFAGLHSTTKPPRARRAAGERSGRGETKSDARTSRAAGEPKSGAASERSDRDRQARRETHAPDETTDRKTGEQHARQCQASERESVDGKRELPSTSPLKSSRGPLSTGAFLAVAVPLLILASTIAIAYLSSSRDREWGADNEGELAFSQVEVQTQTQKADEPNGAAQPTPLPVHTVRHPTEVSVFFVLPHGMIIRRLHWGVENGVERFIHSSPTRVPGPVALGLNQTHRLKLANIPGLDRVELYATLQLNAATPATDPFLQANPLQIAFSDHDFDLVLRGGLVTKLIYLDGNNECANTLLPIGVNVNDLLDPSRVFAVVRIGTRDLENRNIGFDHQRISLGLQEVVGTQVLFYRPEGVRIECVKPTGDVYGIAPVRVNLLHGRDYDLQLSQIAGYEHISLDLTIRAHPRSQITAAFLEHNLIPVGLTQVDVDELCAGRRLTRTIHLPVDDASLAGPAQVVREVTKIDANDHEFMGSVAVDSGDLLLTLHLRLHDADRRQDTRTAPRDARSDERGGVQPHPPSGAVDGERHVAIAGWSNEYRKGRYAESLAFLERKVETDGEDPIYYYLMAMSEFQLGDPGKAAETVRKAALLERQRPIDGWYGLMSRFQGPARLWLEHHRLKATGSVPPNDAR